MGQARDEAGNIWETDAQGNAVRLVSHAGASQGGIYTLPPSPQQTATLNQTGASTGHTVAETTGQNITNQVKGATAPADIAKTNAEAGIVTATAPAKISEAQAAAQTAQFKAEQDRRTTALMPSVPMINQDKMQQLDNYLASVRNAKNDVSGWSTGLPGKMLGLFPGTQAYQLDKELHNLVGTQAVLNAQMNRADQTPGQPGAGAGFRALPEFNALGSTSGPLDPGLGTDKLNGQLSTLDAQAIARMGGVNPYLAKYRLQGLTQQDAQRALAAAQANLNRQIGNLPPAARQVGLQHFNADPTIQALQQVVGAKNMPGTQQAPSSGHPSDIDAIMAKYGAN